MCIWVMNFKDRLTKELVVLVKFSMVRGCSATI